MSDNITKLCLLWFFC